MTSRNTLLNRWLFGLVFFLFMGSIFLFFYQRPSLYSLSAQEIAVGETVTLEGHNLGDPKTSTLVVGGYEVLPRLIRQWTPSRITFTLSENMNSGLIFVKSGFMRSNSLFFTNCSQVPEFTVKQGIGAYLLSLASEKIVPTTEVVVKGRFLGNLSPTRSLVLQSLNGSAQEFTVPEVNLISWTDSEIRFIFPVGRGSGRLYLVDGGAKTNALAYEVNETIARWDVDHEVLHSFRGSITLERESPTGQESFYFWVPEPIQIRQKLQEGSGTGQLTSYLIDGWRVYRISGSQEPLITLERTAQVETARVHVIVNPDLVKPYVKDSPLVAAYTQAPALLREYPSVKELLTSFKIRTLSNPHEAALEIFNTLFLQMQASDRTTDWKTLSAEDKDLSYAQLNSLFVAALKDAKIPAREVLGVLCNERGHTYRMWQWAEFYLEGIGWMPVDIGLSQMQRETFWLRQTENHIALSPVPTIWRGQTFGGEMLELRDGDDQSVLLTGVPWLYENIKGKGGLRLVSVLLEPVDQTTRRRI